MSPYAARFNLALSVVRELRRMYPDSPSARAAVWMKGTWTAIPQRSGQLATVTRTVTSVPFSGPSSVPPFLTYRPDREGD